MSKEIVTQQKQCPNHTLQKIRAELNLEKWPIWKPSKSSTRELKAQVLTKEILLPDGSKIKSSVEVGFTHKGQLTTEDRKTYYALIKMWEDKGRPTEPVLLSLRRLAKTSNKKWGTNVIEATSQSLLRLRVTPFVWRNSYFNATTGATEKVLTAFNILSELKIAQKEEDGHITKETGYFRFNDYILKNLLNNHTKPLYLDVILSLKSEIAQLLYTYIDLIMADKTRYERRSEGLFKDLGLGGTSYRNPSNRKQKLAKALKELQNVDLSTGTLIEAKIEHTTDGKDVKVVLRKQHHAKKSRQSGKALAELPEPSKPETKAQKLVKYFHKQLQRPDQQPGHKELDQVTSLLSAYGYDTTKYLIDYALKEAGKTNFCMRTFGAIFQYQHEALKACEHNKKQQELSEITRRQIDEDVQAEIKREQAALDQFDRSLTAEQRKELDRLVEYRVKQVNLVSGPSSPFYKVFTKQTKYHILQEWRQNQADQNP